MHRSPPQRNAISPAAWAGCARPCWAPTTASSPPPAWCLAWPRRMRRSPAILVAGMRRAGGRRDVDGRGRIRLGAFAGGQRGGRAGDGAPASWRPTVEGEHKELAAIYVGRGLDTALAAQVATQLMAHDALDAHARDELGITETLKAPAAAGGRCVGAELRDRRGAAAAGGVAERRQACCCGRCSSPRWCSWPCWAALAARTGGATDQHRRHAHHVLGRAGDGDHRRCGHAVRRGCLSALRASPP